MPRRGRSNAIHRSRGAVRGWIVFGIVSLVMAGLVVLFIRNLPPPPRYDSLTVTPGSSVPDRSAFGMILEVGGGDSPVQWAWRSAELEVDGRPAPPDDPAAEARLGDDWHLVARLDLQRSQPTIVGLRLEVQDVDLRIGAYEADITSIEARALEERVLDPILVPAGSSTLVFDIRPAGPNPIVRGDWVDEEGRARSLSELSRSTEP